MLEKLAFRDGWVFVGQTGIEGHSTIEEVLVSCWPRFACVVVSVRGFAKLKNSKKIQGNFGGGSRCQSDKKEMENHLKIKFRVHTFHASLPECIFVVYTLLNVVSHYDLSGDYVPCRERKLDRREWVFLFGFLEFV